MVYVVTPETAYEPQAFRVAEFAAYYRWVRRRLEEALTKGDAGCLYPEPTPYCDICRWRQECDGKRRADDHLSLVAGITKIQMGELGRRSIATADALTSVTLPLAWKPERGVAASYVRVREQARLPGRGSNEGPPPL